MFPTLLTLALALAPAAVAQPAPGADMIGLSLPETTLRVDADTLIVASAVELRGDVTDSALGGFSLRFAVDRKELPRLRPPTFDMDLNAAQILMFVADEPVWITATPKPEWQEALRQKFAAGEALPQIAEALSPAGFPALLDLENYTFSGAIQEAEPSP